jgi:DNA phosphorothioation-dependent restriction protein DptH
MTQGLKEIQSNDLAAALEDVVYPTLVERLHARGPGHCMRITDLDLDVMVRLCGRLQADVPDANVVILTDGKVADVPAGLAVTSTKLVELRNPLADGTLRPPLLVFVPNGVRAAAEDSFGVATFEDIHVGDVYGDLRQRLLAEISAAIRDAIAEGLRRLGNDDDLWPYADNLAVVRFLLTGRLNGGDAEAYGGALYELGLVPDFNLFDDPTKVPQRVDRNRQCVDKLTWSPKSERGRVLELGLRDREFRNSLGNYLGKVGLEDPRSWTRRIVHDREYWPLAFNRWEFEDGGEAPESIFIGDVSIELQTVTDDNENEKLAQLVGQKVLSVGRGGQTSFRVKFRVAPAPARVQGLARFVVQVISKEAGPVGLARSKAAWTGSQLQTSVSFSRYGRIEWDEGWHFVRVLAQTEEGELVPLTDEAGKPLPWTSAEGGSAARPNESDLFYVLPAEEVDNDLPQRAVPKEASVSHATLRLQFAALADGREFDSIAPASVEWVERSTRARATGGDLLEVKFPREGAFQIAVSGPLRMVEQKILSAADGPLSWRIPITLGVAEASTEESAQWPTSPEAQAFLEARGRYFEAIRQDSKELVTQAADFRLLKRLVVDYAATYVDLLKEAARRAEASEPLESQRAFSDLRRILSIDTVLLAVTDHRGRRREATLIAPTHPLRALWLATWAQLGQAWLNAAKTTSSEFVGSARDVLLRQLAPVSFPPVLPTESGHVLTGVDNINPFWTLYAPSYEEDPRGLLGDICAAFGLAEPAVGSTVIDGAYLATRVQRYLLQHPYVRTLTINAFNAGRASVLAAMLLHLQKQDAFADLRYDIRLFVPDADAPGVGEALAGLLARDTGTVAREVEAFATPTESHLRPKLRLAVRNTRDFRQDSQAYPAHLSFLFDVFPAEDVGAARATHQEAYAPLHGLVQDFHVRYQEDETTVAWRRQPRHGVATPIPDAEDLTDLLASLSGLLSSAIATLSTGETGLDLRPVITLALDPDDRALLHQVHEVSDWVLTLDRNMGIEFFDHGGKPGRPDYLIDHSPEAFGSGGHTLTITSRSVAELEAMLLPVLEDFNLEAEGRHAIAVLDQLRSLSGRLALKLISSPNQRAEALGLALSRMYLEHQGVFENQIVVPLDAHVELYRALEKTKQEVGDEISFRRTDLALFDLDAKRRHITCRLVEVKCYNKVGSVAAFDQLKTSIAEQIDQSQQVLATHFDPHRSPADRPDRLVKNRELATMLEFYLDRANRYGVMTPEAYEEARYFLRTIESGYRLSFTRSAIVFDFEKQGTEAPEVEHDIEFHRIGINLIQQLVDAAAPETETTASVAESSGSSPIMSPPGIAAIKERRERAPSVPSLNQAAFLGEPRDHSVSWEDLRAQQILGNGATESEAEELQLTTVTPPADVPQPEPDVSTMTANGQSDSESAGSLPVPGEDELVAPHPEVSENISGERPRYDVMLGVTSQSPQYGLLGEVGGRKVALDLNQTHTISLFGVQGGGKSYTLGSIVEMAAMPIPSVNELPHPLATVIFHYSPTMDYSPEFTSMVSANSEDDQVQALSDHYGAKPTALRDVILLVPADKLKERRDEHPGIQVYPLRFAASELQTNHWRFLMGAVGNQATYIRQLNRVMKSLRNNLSLEALRQGLDAVRLPDHLKEMARGRLDLAAEYIDDTIRIGSLIRPGRLVIVDLRDEFIEKDEALGLFVVLLQLFADAKYEGSNFNKLVVFDEAHKYIESPDLVAGLIEVVREMRHKGTSILVASQDPPSVPVALIELSSQVILHKFNSPAWLKHIQKANASLSVLTPEKMANLRPGEAFVWSSKATDEAFTRGAVKVRCRPRVTQHGGATKTAVDET